ncbi:AAA family ATPase [Rhodoferax sp. PAMC 29310]|uniref:AAA family ATPase n=1 Tax=Rhodoferax sp. PAMC 29310 TaxID=2822760 RepID=UPI001F0A1CD0|nr:ATP-binding protein [Rhodoferax sp. PAMC 29310]
MSQALAKRLSDVGTLAIWVPEVLREWCNQEGRPPLAHEQVDVALEQMHRIESASSCDYLIADTHPLMTAIYSELYFSDSSLYPMALEHLRQFDLTLVMGMDLDWKADGIQRDGPVMRQQANTRLRQVLDSESIPYTVIYGTGGTRADSALQAIAHTTKSDDPRSAEKTKPWVWNCEKCSDAQCEHRMFTGQLHIGKP